MPKAVWTGSLNLGLVNIPVSLYAATEPKDVRFHLVDEAGRRVRYRRFVEVEGDAEGASPPSTTPAIEPARSSPADREEGMKGLRRSRSHTGI